MSSPPGPPRTGVAFLLTQLGAHASAEFAAALAESDLNPALVGVLRVLRVEPGLSQQALAARLGLVPSRLVALVDDLESRGWVERARGTADRRVNRLTLTDVGTKAFADIAALSRRHEQRTTSGLDDDERTELHALLTRLVELRGLTPGVHPGYGRLR